MSLRYELTGGFIKNAILSALSIAVSRDGDNPMITQADLLKGASLQLRGRLRMKVSNLYVHPCVCVCVCVCVLACVMMYIHYINACRISIVVWYQLVAWMK